MMSSNWVRRLFAAMVVAACQHAQAYCVSVDDGGPGAAGVEFYIPGAPLRGFKARLYAGQKQCCNWQEKSCNPSGQRDALLKLGTFAFVGEGTVNRCGPVCVPCTGPCLCRDEIQCGNVNVKLGLACTADIPAGGSAHWRNRGDGTWGLRIYKPNGSLHADMGCPQGEDPLPNMKFWNGN